MKPQEITAVILTRDEERNLPRALASLPLGMPVFILDGGSCDRTREFAGSHGARIMEREWHGFVEARRFALTQVQTPWAFAIDADEALDDRLRDALVTVDGNARGYFVRRDTYFCGKPMRLWQGEELLRLVRVEYARVEAQPAGGGDAELHERYVVDGHIGELDGTLLHFSYPDVASYRVKYERYTSIEAQGLKRSSVFTVVGRAISGAFRFVWMLFARGAILDGWRGIYVAFRSAMYPAVVARKALV